MTVDNIDNDNFCIYPVPANDFITIEFNTYNVSGKIQILSLEEKILEQQAINGSTSGNVDVSGLVAGIYFLKIDTPACRYTTKIAIE